MSLLILLSIIYLVNGQMEQKEKPEKCFGDDNIMDRRCCIFPPFFKRDIARSCGARFAIMEINTNHNVTNLKRENADADCSYWKCLLTKYGMLDSNDYLILENYYSHLDRWLSLNPGFNTPLLNAKIHCRELKRHYFPLTSCEFFEFQLCIRGYVNVHCPVYIQSKECMEWKEFYNECKEFYI